MAVEVILVIGVLHLCQCLKFGGKLSMQNALGAMQNVLGAIHVNNCFVVKGQWWEYVKIAVVKLKK